MIHVVVCGICLYNNYKAKWVDQLHSQEAFVNSMGLVISVVCYLKADIPVIMHFTVSISEK